MTKELTFVPVYGCPPDEPTKPSLEPEVLPVEIQIAFLKQELSQIQCRLDQIKQSVERLTQNDPPTDICNCGEKRSWHLGTGGLGICKYNVEKAF
jgi:hypothetical protein